MNLKKCKMAPDISVARADAMMVKLAYIGFTVALCAVNMVKDAIKLGNNAIKIGTGMANVVEKIGD